MLMPENHRTIALALPGLLCEICIIFQPGVWDMQHLLVPPGGGGGTPILRHGREVPW